MSYLQHGVSLLVRSDKLRISRLLDFSLFSSLGLSSWRENCLCSVISLRGITPFHLTPQTPRRKSTILAILLFAGGRQGVVESGAASIPRNNASDPRFKFVLNLRLGVDSGNQLIATRRAYVCTRGSVCTNEREREREKGRRTNRRKREREREREKRGADADGVRNAGEPRLRGKETRDRASV